VNKFVRELALHFWQDQQKQKQDYHIKPTTVLSREHSHLDHVLFMHSAILCPDCPCCRRRRRRRRRHQLHLDPIPFNTASYMVAVQLWKQQSVP
jgi:hypothetical protein